MSTNPHDEDDSPLMDTVLEVMRDACRVHPQDPDVPRDSFSWRWAKFLSLILVHTPVVGGGFALTEYVMQSQGGAIQRRIRNDSLDSVRGRFLIGGGIGSIYVIRCLIRGAIRESGTPGDAPGNARVALVQSQQTRPGGRQTRRHGPEPARPRCRRAGDRRRW